MITEGSQSPRGSSQAWNKFHNSALILSLDKSLDICMAMPQVCHNTISTLLQIVPNNQDRKRCNFKINLWCAIYFILPPLLLYCLNTCQKINFQLGICSFFIIEKILEKGSYIPFIHRDIIFLQLAYHLSVFHDIFTSIFNPKFIFSCLPYPIVLNTSLPYLIILPFSYACPIFP